MRCGVALYPRVLVVPLRSPLSLVQHRAEIFVIYQTSTVRVTRTGRSACPSDFDHDAPNIWFSNTRLDEDEETRGLVAVHFPESVLGLFVVLVQVRSGRLAKL